MIKSKQQVFEKFCISLILLFDREVRQGKAQDTKFKIFWRSSKTALEMLTNALKFILKDVNEKVSIDNELFTNIKKMSKNTSEKDIKIIAEKSLDLLSFLSNLRQM